MQSLPRGLTVLMLVLASGACGCQCCCLTDHYADAVDCVATHETALDALYHPGLDLTRIGREDWCQCRINRALCPCACARCKPLPHTVNETAGASPGAPPRPPDDPPGAVEELPEATQPGFLNRDETTVPQPSGRMRLAPPDVESNLTR